jgi:DNA-binding transcriptional ArsR family regulator
MARPGIGGDVFRAIADETRRRLLDRLKDDEEPVSALADEFDISLPAISQHLKVLRGAGLVVERRVGRERLYSLQPEPLHAVVDWLSRYEILWTTSLRKLRKHLDENP